MFLFIFLILIIYFPTPSGCVHKRQDIPVSFLLLCKKIYLDSLAEVLAILFCNFHSLNVSINNITTQIPYSTLSKTSSAPTNRTKHTIIATINARCRSISTSFLIILIVLLFIQYFINLFVTKFSQHSDAIIKHKPYLFRMQGVFDSSTPTPLLIQM